MLRKLIRALRGNLAISVCEAHDARFARMRADRLTSILVTKLEIGYPTYCHSRADVIVFGESTVFSCTHDSKCPAS